LIYAADYFRRRFHASDAAEDFRHAITPPRRYAFARCRRCFRFCRVLMRQRRWLSIILRRRRLLFHYFHY